MVAGFFLVCWVGFMFDSARGTDNLGFVTLRSSCEDPGLMVRLNVGNLSQGEMSLPMSLDKDGIWRFRLPGKLAVNALHVSHANGSKPKNSFWEISVSPTSASNWMPATVSWESPRLVLTLDPALTPGSLWPSRKHVLNWLGDGQIIWPDARRALYVTLLVWLGLQLTLWLWMAAGGSEPALRPSLPIESSPRPMPTILETTVSNPRRTWPHRLNLLGAGLVFALIAAIFVAMGMAAWPGLHWDATMFATPVINVATGKGWIFGGNTGGLAYRESLIYSSHGVIHVLIFGALLACDTWEKLLLWCGIVNAATFAAWTCLFRRTLRRGGHADLFRPICLGLMAGVIAMGLQGRPEHLAPLLISLPLILRELGVPRRLFQITTYALAGLLFTLSPASGVLFGMGLVFWLSLQYERENNRRFWLELIVAGCAAALTSSLVLTLFCPFSIIEWLTGTFFWSAASYDFSGHLFGIERGAVTGISMDAPLWSPCVLAIVALAMFILLRRGKFVGLAIFAAPIFYCQARLSDYGYVAFFPCILLFLIGRTPSSRLTFSRPKGKVVLLRLGTALGCLYALVFVRTAALSLLRVQHGPSLADTRRQLVSLGAMAWLDHPIATTFNSLSRPSFIVFGDASERYVAGMPQRKADWVDMALVAYSEKFHRPVEFFIYPQVTSGKAPDEVMVGRERYKLIYNGWTMERPRLFGFDLGGAMPGYQFALYRNAKSIALEPADS
jgi:hypothetical protein